MAAATPTAHAAPYTPPSGHASPRILSSPLAAPTYLAACAVILYFYLRSLFELVPFVGDRIAPGIAVYQPLVLPQFTPLVIVGIVAVLALGLAYHGKLLGIPVTVVMPEFAPLIKRTTCEPGK